MERARDGHAECIDGWRTLAVLYCDRIPVDAEITDKDRVLYGRLCQPSMTKRQCEDELQRAKAAELRKRCALEIVAAGGWYWDTFPQRAVGAKSGAEQCEKDWSPAFVQCTKRRDAELAKCQPEFY